jgi:hypothetical protein
MKPMLKAPGTKRLKLKRDIPLSTSAFKINLRRYNVAKLRDELGAMHEVEPGRYRPPRQTISFGPSSEGPQCVLRSSGVGVKWGWRESGLVTTVELIDPRPYIFQVTVYGNLIHTVIYRSDRLLTQANPDPRLPPPPDLRSVDDAEGNICQALHRAGRVRDDAAAVR